MQRFDEKNMVFIVLSSIKTVHGTVKYRYCFFTAQSSLEDWAKMSESLTFICTRQREKGHCKCTMWCTVRFIITLFNVDNVLFAQFIN